jgi:hypothetical protein
VKKIFGPTLALILFISGAVIATGATYYSNKVDEEVAKEIPLKEDVGLPSERIAARLQEVNDKIFQYQVLIPRDQVELLNVFQGILRTLKLNGDVRFSKDAKGLKGTIHTVGSNDPVWLFLANLQKLHDYSKGAISFTKYTITRAGEGKFNLDIDFQAIQ